MSSADDTLSQEIQQEEQQPQLEEEQIEQQKQNRRAVTIANSTIPLQLRSAQITLAPYSPYSKDAQLDKPVVLTGGAPIVAEMPQPYKGRKAEFIAWEITQPIQLPGNQSYAYNIDTEEDGELIHFTVSVDSDAVQTTLIVYDTENRPINIAKDSPRDLAKKGRGMTLSQMLAVDMNGISLDQPGVAHTIMPYLSRAKSTFSLGFSDPQDYSVVAGTENDKFYITEYAPAITRSYQKITFDITNNDSATRTIHYAVVNRIKFLDKTDYGPVPTTPEQVSQGGDGQGNGQGQGQAQKAKIKL